MRTRAVRDGDDYVISGQKAWVTHGGEADFYTLFARTDPEARQGISCFLAPGHADGLSAQSPEPKMGLTGSTTATLDWDDVVLESGRLMGEEGRPLDRPPGTRLRTARDRGRRHRPGAGVARLRG